MTTVCQFCGRDSTPLTLCHAPACLEQAYAQALRVPALAAAATPFWTDQEDAQ